MPDLQGSPHFQPCPIVPQKTPKESLSEERTSALRRPFAAPFSSGEPWMHQPECRSLPWSVRRGGCHCVKMGLHERRVRLYGMLHHSAGRCSERDVLFQMRRTLSRGQRIGIVRGGAGSAGVPKLWQEMGAVDDRLARFGPRGRASRQELPAPVDAADGVAARPRSCRRELLAHRAEVAAGLSCINSRISTTAAFPNSAAARRSRRGPYPPQPVPAKRRRPPRSSR